MLYNITTDSLYEPPIVIPKKNGGERVIHAPKRVEVPSEKLSNVLWECYLESIESKSKEINFKTPSLSHAFEKGKVLLPTLRCIETRNTFLNIDLKNFFDSFNFGRVRGFFIKDRDFAVSPEIATVIAQIACYQGKLPQGSPSSPIITNLITRILDYRIVKLQKISVYLF